MSNKIKGVILAGGLGSRMYPANKSFSKHLLSVYDKPMIYYSFSTIMLAGIKEVLIIGSNEDIKNYTIIFGNGSQIGMKIEYAVQTKPRGIGEAFIIGKKLIGKKNILLILGDNIFFGNDFINILKKNIKSSKKCSIFGYYVKDPQRFGIVKTNSKNKPVKIEEKPKKNIGNIAITGLYYFNNSVVDYIKKIKPSKRGELEITSILNIYLKNNNLNLEILGRGFAWFDAGTHDSFLNASNFVSNLQSKQDFLIACIEEIAFNNKWITVNKLKRLLQKMPSSNYKKYLSKYL